MRQMRRATQLDDAEMPCDKTADKALQGDHDSAKTEIMTENIER